MIEYNQEIIGYITYFENVTKASVKDCFFEGDYLVFVVDQGQLRNALGKGGEKVRKVSARTKKKVKILEFNKDVTRFVLNLLYPMKPEVVLEEDNVVIKTTSNKEKGQIFGREKSNFKRVQAMVKKYFKIDVRVE